MKKFKSTLKYIEHLVKTEGELEFYFEATSYGVVFHWDSYFDESKSIKKLEETLYEYDTQYHSENDLEVGTFRTYHISIVDNKIYGKINYKWNYNILDSKHINEDMNEIITTGTIEFLSNELGISADKFQDKYYYVISFSTYDKKNTFSLFTHDEDKKIVLPKTTWNNLKKKLIELANKHGANTRENDCEFDFRLKSDECFINERWENEMDFELLKDKQTYEEE